MNSISINKRPLSARAAIRVALASPGLWRLGRIVSAGGAASLLATSHAFAAAAAAASTAGSLGEQINTVSSEFIDSGGTAAGMACYISAMIVFIGAAWALKMSREPQNREGGHVAKGVAGLVICGLLVMMPQWINKAAHTAGGADATINSTPAQIKFAP